MRTTEGALCSLECLLDAGVEIGVFTNEPDGKDVSLSDLEEPKFYSRAKVKRDAWKVNAKNFSATATAQTIAFSGKGEPVTGYFLLVNGKVFEYEMFQHPIPNDSNADKIHVTPTIRALSKVA